MNGAEGLNYSVLFSFLDRFTSSKEEWSQMFDDIRVMELAALEEMKKG